MEIEASRLWSS